MKPTLMMLFVGCSWLLAPGAVSAEPGIGDSVVKIFVTQRTPNFTQPWTKSSPREMSGSGFVIDGKRIITNAHVVQYATQIYVQPNQSADKLSAKVIAVGPQIDLAVITLDDEKFFETHPPLPFAEGLPKVKASVNVYGFPIGGDQMSVTEGIVSRVDYASYSYWSTGLRTQIDAALNPGNSGGPAIVDGHIVGVAFSGLQQAQNIGYLIPTEELVAFLKDIEDGKYEGKPKIFDEMQTVENDALRARLGLTSGMGGSMITSVRGHGADYPLKEFDVVTQIGDHLLDSGGNVHVGDSLQLPFHYYVPSLTHDAHVPLTIFRGGQSLKLDVPTSAEKKTLVPYLRGDYPRYFIYGPLVFSPVYAELVAALGDKWQAYLASRNSPIITRALDAPDFEGEELVMVPSPFFSHKITKGYEAPTFCVLNSVNGVSIKNLAHLVALLRDLKDDFVTFKFAGHMSETLVFRRQEMVDATEEILGDNSIRKQASDDLEKIWRSGN